LGEWGRRGGKKGWERGFYTETFNLRKEDEEKTHACPLGKGASKEV